MRYLYNFANYVDNYFRLHSDGLCIKVRSGGK